MMRDLAISYGNSRQAKKWVNKTISFDALKERLKTTIRTTESAEEYAKMSKAQRDAAKDHGGFVGGTLKGGRRKIDTVELRSMIALDGDRIDKAFLDNYETTAPYTSVLYTTHSSTEDSPRVRIIFPHDPRRLLRGVRGGIPLCGAGARHRLLRRVQLSAKSAYVLAVHTTERSVCIQGNG